MKNIKPGPHLSRPIGHLDGPDSRYAEACFLSGYVCQKVTWQLRHYIILFCRNVEIFKIYNLFLKEQNFVKENQEYFGIYRNYFYLLRWNLQSLIQYTFVESALALWYIIYLPNKTPKKGKFYSLAGIKNEMRID